MSTLKECKNSILALKYRTQVCKYYPQCKFGDHCMFIHPDSDENATDAQNSTEPTSICKTEVESETDDIDDYTEAIGCLTMNIRADWSCNVASRTRLIASWCRRIGYPDLAEKALDPRIYEDGRWFRDAWWDGPYGGSVENIKNEHIKRKLMDNLERFQFFYCDK